VCDICLEEEDYEEDEILICELCQAATHQSCYGGEIKNRLPDADQPWFCVRCVQLIEKKDMPCTDIKCSMCPQIKGIIKPITTDKSSWAHVICINWIPEVWFTDDNITTVGGKVPSARSELICGVCHKKNGSCI
jgi:hypothetical protein